MAARKNNRRKQVRTIRRATPGSFVRHTISLPSDISEYFVGRKDEAEFAGNASGYARSLVIAERARRAAKTPNK